MLVGQADAFAMTARQSFSLATLASGIDRSNRVDDISCGETASRGDYRFTGRQTSDLSDDAFAFGEDGGTTSAVDGAVDSTSTHER